MSFRSHSALTVIILLLSPSLSPSHSPSLTQVEWDKDAVVEYLNAMYLSRNSISISISINSEDYDFIDRDYDISSRLDGKGRTVGSSSNSSNSSRSNSTLQWISTTATTTSILLSFLILICLFLSVVYVYPHKICRLVLHVSGGLCGSPPLAATCKSSSNWSSGSSWSRERDGKDNV